MLQKAFELIYEKGYRATSIDDIIATTQVVRFITILKIRTKWERL